MFLFSTACVAALVGVGVGVGVALAFERRA
jgi:hypothetical protein